PTGTQVDECVAAQRMQVGDVVVAAAGDVPARPEAEASEAAVGIEARAATGAARQLVAVVETATCVVARVQQGCGGAQVPTGQLAVHDPFDAGDAGAIDIARQADRRIERDQIPDVVAIEAERPVTPIGSSPQP